MTQRFPACMPQPQSITQRSQARHSSRARSWRFQSRGHGGTLLPRLLSLLSCTLQDHLPRGGLPHSGLGPITSITNQENAHKLAYRPLCWSGAIFPTEVPSSQMPLVYVKSTHTKQTSERKKETKQNKETQPSNQHSCHLTQDICLWTLLRRKQNRTRVAQHPNLTSSVKSQWVQAALSFRDPWWSVCLPHWIWA